MEEHLKVTKLIATPIVALAKTTNLNYKMEKYNAIFQPQIGTPTHYIVRHAINLIPRLALPNASGSFLWSIHELVEKERIKSNLSPCRSHMVLAQKKHGTCKLFIDYRALNKIIVKNQYPLRRIEDSLNQFPIAKFFTKTDLKSRYHQILVEPTNI